MACALGQKRGSSLLQLPNVAAAECMHDMAMQLKQLEEEVVLRLPGSHLHRHGRKGGHSSDDDQKADSASDSGDGAYMLVHWLPFLMSIGLAMQ